MGCLDKAGLVLSETLTDEEFETFLTLLRNAKKTQIFDVIAHIIGDRRAFLVLLDALAADVVKMPSRKELLRAIDAAVIYSNYCRQPYATHEAKVKATVARFRSNARAVSGMVSVVRKVLSKDIISSEDLPCGQGEAWSDDVADGGVDDVE